MLSCVLTTNSRTFINSDAIPRTGSGFDRLSCHFDQLSLTLAGLRSNVFIQLDKKGGVGGGWMDSKREKRIYLEDWEREWWARGDPVCCDLSPELSISSFDDVNFS